MRAEDCALIILASGLSQRFGKADKLMVEFKGKPIVKHVIDAVKDIPFAEHFAVIPERSKRRRKLFNYEGYSIIENAQPEEGQGLSLKLAVQAALEKNHKAVCIMLGDMPFVSGEDVSNFLQNISNENKAICHCNKTVLPPVIFTNSALEELMNIAPQSGAKALFNSGDFYKHPLSERAARDIDTLETLAELS